MGAPLTTAAGQSRTTVPSLIAGLRRTPHGRAALYLASIGLVALAYYLAGRIGLELAYLDGAVAAIWPPAGLGLAVLILYGPRLVPGIVIGDLLLGDFSTPLGTVLAQTIGNTVALVVAAELMRRLTNGRTGLGRVFDVVAFIGCALVAALVSAAFGPLALRLGGVITTSELDDVFRTWTLGDAAGALVVAPALLTWATFGLRGIRRRDVAEGGVVLVVLLVLAELAPQRDVPYLVFPALLWAALRFGPRGAATAILIVCSITVWNTAENDGPFVRASLTDSLLATQLFIAIAAVTSLLLAAVTAERIRAARKLAAAESAQRALADEQAALRRVATLVAGEAPPSRVFEQATEEVARLLGLPGANIVQYDGARTMTVVGAWSENGPPSFPVGQRLDIDSDTALARVVRTGAAARVDRYEGRERDAGRHAPERRLPVRGRGAGPRQRTDVGRAGGGQHLRRPAPERHRAAAVRLRGPRRAGAGERRRVREAGGLARAARRGRRRRAAAAGAQPPRRRSAAPGLGRPRPEHGRGQARERPAAGARAAVVGAGGSLPRPRGAARARARHPPGRPHRARARPGARLPRGPRAAAGRRHRGAGGAAVGAVEAAAYYVVAEAITNVAKYAHASSATVSIDRSNGAATVVVADDGVGGADPAGGTGLRGLAARVEALNGRLDVDSPPGGGTRIKAEIPLVS